MPPNRPLPAMLMAGVLLALLVSSTPGAEAQEGGRILVVGDLELAKAAEARGWPGDGTAAKPYVISDLEISAAGGHGIELSRTTKHVVIRNLLVEQGGARYDGIRLVSVRNVAITDIVVESSRTALHIERSSMVKVDNSTLRASTTGILLLAASDVSVHDNRIQLNQEDVRFERSPGNHFLSNNLSISTGQIGFSFADSVSYVNHIDASNVVNSVPMRWYVDVAGTATQPLVIRDAQVTLVGMTNVGQVGLIKAAHIRLEDPLASGGTAAGLLVYDSRDVRVEGGLFLENKGAGVQAERSAELALFNTTAHSNAGAGVQLSAVTGCLVERLAAGENGGHGFQAAGSPGCLLGNSTLESNKGAGIHAAKSPGLLVLDSEFLNNTGGGMHLLNVLDGAVVRSTFEENKEFGVHLQSISTGTTLSQLNIGPHAQLVRISAGAGAWLHNNTLTMDEGQTAFHFQDLHAYGTRLDTTNLVNGSSVRWYTGLRGTPEAPIVIEGLDVSLKGITNVAQVMLHDVEHVRLVSPQATNGSAAGVRVHASKDVTVHAPHASGNEGAGIEVTDGDRIRVEKAEASGNAAEGIRIRETTGALVESAQARDNLHGVVVFKGSARIANSTFEANQNSGVTVFGAGHALDGLLVRDNGDFGIVGRDAGSLAIRDARVLNNTGPGISLERGSHEAHVQNVTLADNGGGLRVSEVRDARFARMSVSDNGDYGIQFARAGPGIRVSSSTLEGHDRGVSMAKSTLNTFTGNRIAIADGQTGFYFEDEASYDNRILQDNLVNDVAVRWYNGLAGTVDRPERISGITVELPGVTNVAQVMVHRSSYVVLDDITARNGTAGGIVLHRSSDITVRDSLTENNTRGIALHQTLSSIIEENQVLGGEAGVHLQRSSNNVIARNDATGAQVAVLVADKDSKDNLIEDNIEAPPEPLPSEVRPVALRLSTSEPNVGGGVQVYVDVRNDGVESATDRLVLKANGEEVGAQNVTLKPGESKQVRMTYRPTEEGVFTLRVGSLSPEIVTVGPSLEEPEEEEQKASPGASQLASALALGVAALVMRRRR